MSEAPIVEIDHVSKKFCRNLRRSLWYGVKDLAKELALRDGKERLELRPFEFLALNDVSFKLRSGECVGLIGSNGAGKSTLLKLINGLIRPDAGRITIRGRVGALIELGTGFSPILTGRENIYANGAVLGFSKKDIDMKFDEIMEFAGLGEAINAPVQSYSSGMRVRLGFAVAGCLDPDILLVDEVLAVGDAAFRLKCLQSIRERVDSGMGILLVSHQMGNIINICDRAIWLDEGTIRASGEAAETCVSYERFLAQRSRSGASGLQNKGIFDSGGGNQIVNVGFLGANHGHHPTFSAHEEIRIAVKICCQSVIPSLVLTFGLRTFDEILAYGSRYDLGTKLRSPGCYQIEIRIPPFSLLSGRFYFSCGLSRDHGWGHVIQNIPHSLDLSVNSDSEHTKGIADLKPLLTISKSE